MNVIYEPKGKAREYSPLALNYYQGCNHGCLYCYVPDIQHRTRDDYQADVRVRPGILNKLRADLQNNQVCDQVLLSFAGDPYCQANEEHKITRQVLSLLLAFRVPTAILTKGGHRLLADLDILQKFKDEGIPIKVGATLAFTDEADREKWEPGATELPDRLDALAQVKELGIRTWASLEPVVDPEQSLEIIQLSLGVVDEYKLGKLNNVHPEIQKAIDWTAYTRKALDILHCQRPPVGIYVKKDLREATRGIEYSQDERTMDASALRGAGVAKQEQESLL